MKTVRNSIGSSAGVEEKRKVTVTFMDETPKQRRRRKAERDDFGWRRNAVDYVGLAEQELDIIIEEDGESDGSEISDDDGFVGR
jgi:hypothetical protein